MISSHKKQKQRESDTTYDTKYLHLRIPQKSHMIYNHGYQGEYFEIIVEVWSHSLLIMELKKNSMHD